MNLVRTDLEIRDLGCGGGSARTVEHVLASVPGVVSAYVNPATETAYVAHDLERCSTAALVRVIRELGFEVRTPAHEQARGR